MNPVEGSPKVGRWTVAENEPSMNVLLKLEFDNAANVSFVLPYQYAEQIGLALVAAASRLRAAQSPLN